MKNYTDEELMSFVRNHDISAFEELLGRYERRIFAFFYRLIWDAEEARDYTQETFLRLWRGRAAYVPKGKFSTYVFQIAKNHFLHEYQKRQLRANLKEHAFPSDPAQKGQTQPDSTCNQAMAHEIGLAISKAVCSLPEVHRLVYVLSEGQRLSYQEIAEILDCPVGTVSSRKVEAVRKLRRLLEPLRDGVFGDDRQVGNSEVRK